MLTLTKFLVILAVIFGIVFAVIFSLATFVEPGSRDMSFTVRADKLIRDSQ